MRDKNDGNRSVLICSSVHNFNQYVSVACVVILYLKLSHA